MSLTKSTLSISSAAVAALAALVVAGCGSSGDSATAAPAPSKTASGGTATVGVGTVGLGKVLIDAHGRTLYLFAKDAGTNSACNGPCAGEWPPLRASGTPTAGGGASASALATTTRPDGQPQVAYHGHPLYRFSGDHKPGDTNGQGLQDFGGGWYTVSPAGNRITTTSPTSSSGSGY